jgi:AAA15 family ATPase/GTPase
MFKKIAIKGFRGIKELELDDFRQINLFVGKNNCGKSTILESLYLAISPTNAHLPVKINMFRGLQYLDENMWLTLFHKMSRDSNITISTELNNKDERKLVIEPNMKSATNVAITNTKIRNKTIDVSGDISGSSLMFPVINGLRIEYSVKQKNVKNWIKYNAQVTLDGNNLEITPPKGYKENLKGTYLNPQTIFLDIPKIFDEIQVRKQIDLIVDVLKEIDDSLVNLSLGKDVIYCDIGLDRLMPINVMGDGMYRLLAIVLAISTQQDGILLIDEIDTGLHYSTQEVLWNVIFKSAKKFNVQIFASTHSLECIKAFSSTYFNQLSKEVDIKLYRIEKRDDDIKAIDYDGEVLAASLESGWEMR